MAIGLARMFGIQLPLNFFSPYKARNIAEVWHRWHMTLSRFLRDYLYIPLGGNRKGSARRYLNLIITFALGGFWHGAGWKFPLLGAHAWRLSRSLSLLGPIYKTLFGTRHAGNPLGHAAGSSSPFSFLSWPSCSCGPTPTKARSRCSKPCSAPTASPCTPTRSSGSAPSASLRNFGRHRRQRHTLRQSGRALVVYHFSPDHLGYAKHGPDHGRLGTGF